MSDMLPITSTVFKRLPYFIAFGFGVGLSPIAPGTVATGVALLIYIGLQALPIWGYCLFLVIGFIIGVYVSNQVTQDLKVHDYPGIVIDEWIGFWVTMFWIPCSFMWLILGFFLFRFFDILKPWPIGYIDQKVKGGLGIMLDDVLAGFFSHCVLQGLLLISRSL